MLMRTSKMDHVGFIIMAKVGLERSTQKRARTPGRTQGRPRLPRGWDWGHGEVSLLLDSA